MSIIAQVVSCFTSTKIASWDICTIMTTPMITQALIDIYLANDNTIIFIDNMESTPEQNALLYKVNPVEHKHWKLPGVFLQICSQFPLLLAHSSISIFYQS